MCVRQSHFNQCSIVASTEQFCSLGMPGEAMGSLELEVRVWEERSRAQDARETGARRPHNGFAQSFLSVVPTLYST